MNHLRTLFTMVAGAGLVVACSDIETTPAIDDLPRESTPSNIDEVAVQEPFVPGDQWYEYDARTHVVTPSNELYLLRGDANDYLLQITSYYDERGESGTFSYRVRSWRGDEWSDPRSGEPAGSVKEAPVCVDLDAAAITECGSDDWEVVFRIDARVVPYGGFAVNNPAIHPRGHHWAQEQRLVTHRLPGLALDEVVESPETLASGFEPELSAKIASDAGVLANVLRDIESPADVFLHATNDLRLVQWRASTSGVDIAFDVRCAELAMSAEEQDPLTQADVRTHVVQLPDEGPRGFLLDLCADSPVVSEYTAPLDGLWPDTRSFDLVLETSSEGPIIRLAPGSLALRVKINGSDASAPMEPVEVDPRIWAE